MTPAERIESEEFVDEWTAELDGENHVVVEVNDAAYIWNWDQVALLNQALMRLLVRHRTGRPE